LHLLLLHALELSLVSIRQHTSAYVSIRQHTSPPCARALPRQHTSAYVSIRQHTSAYVSIRHLFLHALELSLVSILQHTSAYVSIRQHTSPAPPPCARALPQIP
jgi:hypothetical protein